MEDIRPKGAWYAVYIDGPGWKIIPQNAGYYGTETTYLRDDYIVPLDHLADALPHGAGIDGDWHIHVHKNGNLTVTGELHCMDGNGMYDGWERFSFRIYRAPKDQLNPLKGPCAGKVQVIHRKGDVILGPVRGIKRERYRDGYTDYLEQSIGYSLQELIPPMRNETIDA